MMKSTDKLTPKQILPNVIGYVRKHKCDVIIFDRHCCGADFMLKSLADKSGIKGITVEYGKTNITVTHEDKTTEKVKTSLDKTKEEKPKIKESSKVIDKKVEAEDKPETVQGKE